MKNTDVFSQLYSQYKGFQSELKGSWGEFLASFILKAFSDDNIRVIRNVFVPLSNGKTAEIDIVVIHNTGIYAIECKNYSGWIFGSSDNQKWTQTFSNGQHYTFYNPVLQNKYHISALSKYLSVSEQYFKSYIVFGEKAQLKKVPQNTSSVSVMKTEQLALYLSNDIRTRENVFADSVVEQFSEAISALTDTTGQKKRDHVRDVRQAHPENNEPTPQQVGSFFSSFFRF